MPDKPGKAGAGRQFAPPAVSAATHAQMSLEALVLIVLRHWKLVLSVAIFAGLTAYAFSWLVTPAFRSTSVLMPVGDDGGVGSVLGGQLGGLAAIAGVSTGGGSDVQGNIEYLKSHELSMRFIEQLELLPVIFADDFDVARGVWRDGEERTLRNGDRELRSRIMSIHVDGKTRLITISCVWQSPQLAADWCNRFVAMANERLRQKALASAVANLEFLKVELASTNIVALNQALARLIESETREAMLARGRSEYAFRVIDPAVLPDARDRVRPRRSLMALFGAVFGGLASGLVVMFRVRRRAWTSGD